MYFPQRESVSPEDEDDPSKTEGERVEAAEALLSGRARVMVATRRGAPELAPIPDDIADLRLTVATGQELRRDALIAALEAHGFERAPMVEEAGRYAVRGGLVDLFSFGAAGPARVEFWGDEVESMRRFDILDQRSTEPVERIDILPVRFGGRPAPPGAPAPRSSTGCRWTPSSSAPEPIRGEKAPKRPGSRPRPATGKRSATTTRPPTPPPCSSTPQRWPSGSPGIPGSASSRNTSAKPVFQARRPPPFERKMNRLRTFLGNAAERGAETWILCDNDGQAQRLDDLLADRRGTPPPGCHLVVGSLNSGFRIEDSMPVVNILTDHEIFRRGRKLRRGGRFRGAAALESLAQLSPGDHIVHMEHGSAASRGWSGW